MRNYNVFISSSLVFVIATHWKRNIILLKNISAFKSRIFNFPNKPPFRTLYRSHGHDWSLWKRKHIYYIIYIRKKIIHFQYNVLCQTVKESWKNYLYEYQNSTKHSTFHAVYFITDTSIAGSLICGVIMSELISVESLIWSRGADIPFG